MKFLIGISFCALPLFSCDKDYIEVQAPKDQFNELCNGWTKTSGPPKLNKTTVTCETRTRGKKLVPVAPLVAAKWGITPAPLFKELYKEISVAQPPDPTPHGPALIVLIEPGTYDANLTLVTNNLNQPGTCFGTVLAKYQQWTPNGFKKFFRTLVYNFVYAFLEHTFKSVTTGDYYKHVYIVKGDVELKTAFLNTIGLAIHNNDSVDMLLIGHGLPGYYMMTQLLKDSATDPANLTADDLIKWAHDYPAQGELAKVRGIFQTHSFVGERPPAPPTATDPWGESMFDAYHQSFPNALFYGGAKTNFYPLHRDLVAFESYYKIIAGGAPFAAAYNAALDLSVKYTQFEADGVTPRTKINYPIAKGIGCIFSFSRQSCAWVAMEPNSNFAPPPFIDVSAEMYSSARPTKIGPGVLLN